MPGIPINSLQDLLVLRELKNQSNFGYSAMQALSEGVAQGIKQKQEEAKKKKEDAENLEKTVKMAESFNKTNSGKLGQLIPSVKIDEKGIGISYSNESLSQQATRIKTEMETESQIKLSDTIKKFNAPDSNLTVQDLIEAGVKPSDAKTMEELRGPINQSRQQILSVSAPIIESINSDIGDTVVINKQSTSGGIVAPKLSGSLRPEEFVDIGAQKQIDTAKAEIEVAKEVRAQQAKAGELSERGVQRAASASNTAFDEVLRFNQENMEKYGISPGQAFGWIERLLPDQLNKYKAAAVGAGREAAATVGTQIIPSARAVRMVDIFAKSTAEVGNTIEGNAANAAASMANAWGNAITTNFEVELKDGKKVPLKDVVKDPLTGEKLSDIPYPDILTAIGRATEEFKLKTEDYYLQKAFEKNPSLLKQSTVDKMEEEKRLRRIQELRSKI